MSILLGNCLYGNNISSCEEKDDIIVQISSILKEIDIEPVFLKSNKDIIWIRDIFVIIDNICFICNLTQRDTIGNNRRNEYKALLQYLNTQFLLKFIPKNIMLEGGDIIQDGNNIFLGIGKRTNMEAYYYLNKHFNDKNIYPIEHNSLHLDCIFTVLNDNKILINKNYIEQTVNIKSYTVIDVSSYVSIHNPISLNFLVIGNNILCSNLIESEKILNILNSMNYRVWSINTHNLWKEGGGIRCMTQWLYTIGSQKIY